MKITTAQLRQIIKEEVVSQASKKPVAKKSDGHVNRDFFSNERFDDVADDSYNSEAAKTAKINKINRSVFSNERFDEGAYDLNSADAIGEDDGPGETFKTYKSVVVYLLAGSVRMKEYKNKRVDVVADLLKVDGERLKYGDESLGRGYEACTAVNADRVPVALVVGSDSSDGQTRGLEAIRKLAVADESDEDEF